jgi:hypothetical protein
MYRSKNLSEDLARARQEAYECKYNRPILVGPLSAYPPKELGTIDAKTSVWDGQIWLEGMSTVLAWCVCEIHRG